VLHAIRSGRTEGVTTAALRKRLAAGPEPSPGEAELAAVLSELEERGEIVRSKGRVTAIEFTDYFSGSVRLTARGFAVVRLGERDIPDIVVPPEQLGSALDGDEVLVHRGSRRRRGRLEPEKFGEIVRVLRRRRPTLVGRFVPDPVSPWVAPFARRVALRVDLDPVPEQLPRAGEFVEVAVSEVPEGGRPRGRLLRRLGAAGESGVDEEVALAELAIPVVFPPDAVREAERLPGSVSAHDLEGRADHRGQPAVTIDGETAKDFDDAVVAFQGRDGAIEVFVHIADVAHYVTPGSALDAAARERGTSVYLPGRCVPMLPEKLSNGLCSLLPGEDRLAFSLRFIVTPAGAVEGCRAERSVFRSRRRCTYDEVFDWLDSGRWPADLGPGVRESLLVLDEAARRLGGRRRERGAIDFDLPEPEILLDPDGFMTGVQATPRNRAHRLIEELMIAANEGVARVLVFARQPGLFRVHERPSAGRLAELQVVLDEFGIALKGDLEELPPRELQRVLDEIARTPGERFLQTLVLRALARAEYLPACKGHYALATSFYLHFTSPIRRYPDLVVHRFLAHALAGTRWPGATRDMLEAELEELARHCSLTERRAEEAERLVVRWKQAEFMRAHVGEEFLGHVTGVVAFGLFVQLEPVFVEGLVHVTDLADDFYRYDEVGHRLVGQRRGRVLRLGDALQVCVKGVDEETLEVKLVPLLPSLLAQDRARSGPSPEQGKRRSAPRPRPPGPLKRRRAGMIRPRGAKGRH
jgi:ribonuclease R